MSPEQQIAVVGLAGRFPGAATVERLWEALRQGVEAVTPLSTADLEAAGVPAELYERDAYVRSAVVLEDVELFDAELFGLSPREAAIMDPQHRLYLETAWRAFEDAGHDPRRFPGPVGSFAGCQMSQYLLRHLAPHPTLLAEAGALSVRILNDKDFLANRVSYEMDLDGPAFSVQAACSSSLVAVHLACQSLLSFESDMVLAGGVSITLPQGAGYLWSEGGIYSPDGHCRAFAADAAGTINGSGAGAVVLRRLEDALADGDRIRAVIRGSALNNDGRLKLGFTAPSLEGQSQVVAAALEFADVDPATIGYVEAHGTGTPLGDPVEVAALTRAFRQGTDRTGYCALGSIKTNIGHLDAAAGVAGLIKAVLAVEHGEIPPSLHAERPHPEIAFDETPFYLADRLIPWPGDGTSPRRAGVSALAVGGTNVHVVLEQAPPTPERPPAGTAPRLLVLSAHDPTALDETADQLAAHLESAPDLSLADVAFTLRAGRREMAHRRVLVADHPADAAAALASRDPDRVLDATVEPGTRSVVFAFPGQGSQYPDMARGLYDGEPVFRRQLDRATDILATELPRPLPELLWGDGPEAAARLEDTAVAQPVLVAVEHALAQLWMDRGIEPRGMIGHSVGEWTAACLAGVLSLEDTLGLVAQRGRLMASMPAGSMVSVERPADEVEALAAAVSDELALAAVNAPDLVTVSGPTGAIEELAARLATDGVGHRLLHTSHAFHSSMMDPIVEPFRQRVAQLDLAPPKRPWVSNRTGIWITDAQATDPTYWAEHLRRPVRFAEGVATLAAEASTVLLEVGPGRTLSSFARRAAGALPSVVSVRHPRDRRDDRAVMAEALGRLWLAGVEVDWGRLPGPSAGRRRVSLPGLSFQRRRHWVEPPRLAAPGAAVATVPTEAPERSGAGLPATPPAAGPAEDGELEGRLAALFGRILGHESVGPRDDFFDLGGHSLLASRLMVRIQDELGARLTVSDLFASPTPAGLAVRMRRQQAGPAPAALPPLRPAPRGGDLPLSAAQERIWFLEQLAPGSAVHHVPVSLRLDGPLSRPGFARALTLLVARHEALRTGFENRDGVPVQVPRPPVPLAPPVVDLTALDDARRGPESERLAAESTRRPFALDRPPLVRAVLVDLGGEEPRHLLLLTLHHLVVDGWSLGLLTRDLGALYRRALGGGPGRDGAGAETVLPVLPVQPADHAVWQRSWLDDERVEPWLAYWRQRMTPEPPLLELPTDRPRGPGSSPRGARRPLVVGRELRDGLDDLARRGGATVFMVLTAAYGALLGRLSGARDLTVGTPVAGRRPAEVEELVGLFINPLVLRLDLAGDPTFAELLERTRDTAVGAFDHQELPFERLVEEISPERRTARPPLFQALLLWQNAPAPPPGDLGGLRLARQETDRGVAPFDLTLALVEPAGDGPLAGHLEWKADLFDTATIERWSRLWSRLLGAVVADPSRRLSELPWLSPAEEQLVRLEAPAPDRPVDPTPIAARIARRAGRHPDRPAVVQGEVALSYGELVARVERLRRTLVEGGAGPEEVVAIAVPRTPDLVVALLAVWAAGAAYVPLDLTYPQERLATTAADSGARLAIASEATADRLERSGLPLEICRLDGASAAEPAAIEAVADRWARPAAEQLAYVLYTSGSSGRPKGVEIPHRALADFLASMEAPLSLDEGETLLAVTSLGFDISLLELLAPLLAGATVDLVADEVAADGERLAAHLSASAARVMQATPSTWSWLVASGWRPKEPRLRLALTGGEALPTELARQLGRRVGRLINVYGPTETTVWSTLAQLADGPAPTGSTGPTGSAGSTGWTGSGPPIGRPLANTIVQVVDPVDGRGPVPLGSAGELLIGGVGLARGYRGRPAATAERFVPDPFSGTGARWSGPGSSPPGSRLYRTGDRVRHRADGQLEFLGRLDGQIKLRGHRIELGEIEAALVGLPGVSSAAAALRGAGDDRHLVAFLVGADDGPPPEAEVVRAALRERLPEVMVPALFVPLDELPLTPNRKVDRQRLEHLAASGAAVDPLSAAPTAPPSTEMEIAVAEIWRDVLPALPPGGEIGIGDSFFDLGGHSLLATRVLARLRSRLSVDLALGELFAHPTLGALAARLDERSAAAAPSPALPTIRRRRRGGGGLAALDRTLETVEESGGGGAG